MTRTFTLTLPTACLAAVSILLGVCPLRGFAADGALVGDPVPDFSAVPTSRSVVQCEWDPRSSFVDEVEYPSLSVDIPWPDLPVLVPGIEGLLEHGAWGHGAEQAARCREALARYAQNDELTRVARSERDREMRELQARIDAGSPAAVEPSLEDDDHQARLVRGWSPESLEALQWSVDRARRQEESEQAELEARHDTELSRLDGEARDTRRDLIDGLESMVHDAPDHGAAARLALQLAQLHLDRVDAGRRNSSSPAPGSGRRAYRPSTFHESDRRARDLSQVLHWTEVALEVADDPRVRDHALLLDAVCRLDAPPWDRELDRALASASALATGSGDSQYAGFARFLVGDIHAQHQDFEAAAVAFASVRAEVEPDLAHLARHMRARSLHRAGDTPGALQELVSLVDTLRADRGPGEAGPVARASLLYMAACYHELARENDAATLDQALDHVDALGPGGTPWTHRRDALLALSDWLPEVGSYEDAMDVLQRLLADYPEDPEAPRWQAMMARLFIEQDLPDVDAAWAAFAELLDYGEGSSWWLANLGDPDALAMASNLVADALFQQARDVHRDAMEANPENIIGAESSRSIYLRAAARYGDFLLRYPLHEAARVVRISRAD